MITASEMESVNVVNPIATDIYFSADVETDGPIPGPFSLLSFALVVAGTFDGKQFERPSAKESIFIYRELRPISSEFQPEAMAVNGLNRNTLLSSGTPPSNAMTEAAQWVKMVADGRRPVLVAYPLSFDWSWLYWYFVRFSSEGSPFSHSHCFDLKTAYAVKSHQTITDSGRAKLPNFLRSSRTHSHNALDDAFEQADIFANLFEWKGTHGNGSQR